MRGKLKLKIHSLSLILSLSTEGTTLTEPLKLTKTFRMRNAGTSLMRIRRVGLGLAGMCEWNGFRVSHCGEDIMIHANRTKKLELSYVHAYSGTSIYWGHLNKNDTFILIFTFVYLITPELKTPLLSLSLSQVGP